MRPIALALFLLGGTRPHWFRPAFAPPAADDAPCTVAARAAERGHHPEDLAVTFATLPWDLDGDQRDDLFVVHGCGATGNCTGLLYLSSQGCRHPAGELGGVRFERLAQRSHGLAGLSSFWGSGCVGTEGVIADWAWDGRAYRQVRTIGCACVAEPEAATNPARCSPRG